MKLIPNYYTFSVKATRNFIAVNINLLTNPFAGSNKLTGSFRIIYVQLLQLYMKLLANEHNFLTHNVVNFNGKVSIKSWFMKCHNMKMDPNLRFFFSRMFSLLRNCTHLKVFFEHFKRQAKSRLIETVLKCQLAFLKNQPEASYKST